MLNFYKSQSGDNEGFWFKIFVPNSVTIIGVSNVDNRRCMVLTNSGAFHLTYASLDKLMWEVMSGTGLSEEEIENTFSKIWD